MSASSAIPTPSRRRRGPGAADLLNLARKRFVKGEGIELETLATELDVSRATAYRWAGNAEELVGQVIAGLVEDTFRRLQGEAKGKGAARVLDSMTRGMRYIAGFRPLREFLEKDPQKGLRIIASKEGPVQALTIRRHQQLLEEEIRKGNLRLPVDAHTMAYALTRISESFLYADFIAGEEPDLKKAMEILKLLLR